MEGHEEADAALVARLIAGDRDALGHLYDRHAGTVYRAAYRLLRDTGAAEDVVQETMLTLWDRAEVYDATVASLGGWLTTIARNRAIDRLRMSGRRIAAAPVSTVSARAADDPAAATRILEQGVPVGSGRLEQEPSAITEAAWVRRTLAEAVAALPAPERQVIELAYSADLSQAEIAAQLGWPLGTVKTRTRRAMASLRSLLADTLAPAGVPAGTSRGAPVDPGRAPAARERAAAPCVACP